MVVDSGWGFMLKAEEAGRLSRDAILPSRGDAFLKQNVKKPERASGPRQRRLRATSPRDSCTKLKYVDVQGASKGGDHEWVQNLCGGVRRLGRAGVFDPAVRADGIPAPASAGEPCG